MLIRALVVVLLIGVATRASADDAYRFLDHSVWPVTTLTIEGVLKRVLHPHRSQEVFELPASIAEPVLVFSIGQQPVSGAGTVRFEIELERPAGIWTPVYQKDLSTPGWVDARIPLSGDLAGAHLRFRRKMLSGTREAAKKSAWGDPVLLPSEQSQRPSIIVISLDTLRADRLGLYGHQEARTPALDAFGRSAVWYADAYSPSAWTLPSHASLLYGRLLPAVPERRPAATPPASPQTDPQSLAEVLRAQGYLTAGFTGGGYVSSNFGFDRGFDTYFSFQAVKPEQGTCPPQRFDGAEVFQRATAWVRDRGRAPFFLFLHTYDVHDRCPFQNATRGHDDQPWDNLTDDGYARLLAYYDGLITEIDTRIGVLLAEIDRLGLRDNTIVVITSDHGELFNEHGMRGHGCTKTLYEGLIRVPLLIRYPARLTARAITGAVSLLDVAPTILSLVHVPQPASMSGLPLPGLGPEDTTTRAVLATCDDQVAVRQGAFKLIAANGKPAQSQLFDLAHDAAERDNLFTSNSGVAQTLLREAERQWHDTATAPTNAPRELDAQTRERLRALGYME